MAPTTTTATATPIPIFTGIPSDDEAAVVLTDEKRCLAQHPNRKEKQSYAAFVAG